MMYFSCIDKKSTKRKRTQKKRKPAVVQGNLRLQDRMDVAGKPALFPHYITFGVLKTCYIVLANTKLD